MSFGGGLKRLGAQIVKRKVPQSIAIYLVSAAVLLGGAHLFAPSIGVPPHILDALLAALLLMLPVVVILSWIFDLRPNRLERKDGEAQVGVTGSGSPAPGSPLSAPTGAAGSRTGSEISASLVEPLLNSGALPTPPEAAEGGSVAILPFVNNSPDPEGEYLSDGITETIINKMAKVSNLRVIPRASAFRYKASAKDVQEISQELGVRAVVTGSVQHVGEHLVVQAELVDTVREAQIWGERYSGLWSNLFDVQEGIATQITKSLKPELSGEEREKIEYRETDHLEAYRAYLRGRFCWGKRTAEGLSTAVTHFQSAIERDPLYALAYCGLADTYNIMGYYSIRSPDQTYPLAKQADNRALEIQPNLAEAYASLGYCTLFYDRDWDAASQNFQRAIELDPIYGTAHQWHAWYFLVQERFDEALNAFKQALTLDPLSLVINDHLAYGFMLAGQMPEARKQIERTRRLDATYPLALWRLGDWHLKEGEYAQAVDAYAEAEALTDGRYTLGYLGLTYGLMGRADEARAVLARLEQYAPERFVSPLDRAFVHAGLGEVDAAFQLLEVARSTRVSDMVRFKLLPWPQSIRSDSRYAGMIRQLNLPA